MNPVFDLDALFTAARAAREKAHAPYSHFPVGAALQAESGAIFSGCNVENAAYPSGTCAETAAIAAMVLSGERAIRHIVVVGAGAPIAPCGACRQRILEFATGDTLIHLGTDDGPTARYRMRDLLPHAFSAGDLGNEHP